MNVKVVVPAVALGLLLSGITAWRVIEAVSRRSNVAQETTGQPKTPVEVVRAEQRDLREEVHVAGTMRALHEADVVSDVPGRVQKILADVGDRVAADQPLARLDDHDLGLQVKQSEAGLAAATAASETAARDLAGAVSAAEVGGISDAGLVAAKSRAATAQAQVDQAEATLGLARSRLADTVVRAPFAGVVVRRMTDIGSQIAPGVSTFGVADLSSLELVLDVDERVAARLKPGDSVGITSDTIATLPDGTVKTVSPMLDAASHKAQVIVGMTYVPGLFGHGGATGTLRLGSATGVVAVPSRAILDDKGEPVVYTVEDGVAHRTVVHAGLRDGDWIEVQGLLPEASVVVTGNAYLSDGAQVDVRPTDPS